MIILAALLDAVSFSGTIVTLDLSDAPGFIAEVTMDNHQVNSTADERTVALSVPGVDALVTFAWETGPYGADSIIVTPPDGMACKPASCVLEVEEGQADTLYLFEWEGM